MIEKKYYPLNQIWQMFEEDKITEYELLDLTNFNCALFAQLILELPYALSENQLWILDEWSTGNYRQLLLVCGRKSAKTDLSAIITLWEIYKILQKKPTPQEYYSTNKKIFANIIGSAQKEALDVTFGAVQQFVEKSSWFQQYIENETKDTIQFIHDIYVTVQSSSARAARGYASVINVYDEIAHFLDSRGNLSGDEVYYATIPNLDVLIDPATKTTIGKSVLISSPGGRQGIFWELFKKGKPLRIIQNTAEHGQEAWRAVFQLPTWEMNPNLPLDSKHMQEEEQNNPDRFRMERGAEFCDVIDAAFPRILIYACAGGTVENGYRMIGESVEDKTTRRVLALDPALTGDSYGLALGHREMEGNKDIIIIDLVQYWQARTREEPINIVEVENRVRELNRRFRLTDIILDQYQSASTIQRLEKEGLRIYKVPPQGLAGQKYMQVAYEAFGRRINTQTIRYPWHHKLLNELTFLQRKTTSTTVRYEAAMNYSDDLADSIARIVFALDKPETGVHIGW